MKVTIKNFGPIQRFEYDLDKDIIVTYGDNNIGKSYAMQIVYLLLKNLVEYADYYNGRYYYSYSASFRFDSPVFDSIKKVVDRFSLGRERSQNITKNINDAIVSDMTTKFVSNFLNSCGNTFGNFKSILEQQPQIDLVIERYNIRITLSEERTLQCDIYNSPTFLKRSSSDFHKSRNANGRFDIYYYDNTNTPISVIVDTIIASICEFSQHISLSVGNVYFLPASRSGIYSGMSAFSSIIAELSKNKAMLTKKIELPGISEPISDYFLMLSGVRMRESNYYSSVYNEIEQDILHGTVKFNRTRNTLVYIPDGIKHEFEMTEVSSMVSEVSPIVAFLKYIISSISPRSRTQRGESIVFIEEPEAHLHPKNQIKLIELFSKLHEFNIKVVISSHSNYVFSKLNNLLLGRKISPDLYSPILLQQGEAGSISSFMNIDELGVDDSNFMDATQELYSERERLIAEYNQLQD